MSKAMCQYCVFICQSTKHTQKEWSHRIQIITSSGYRKNVIGTNDMAFGNFSLRESLFSLAMNNIRTAVKNWDAIFD